MWFYFRGDEGEGKEAQGLLSQWLRDKEEHVELGSLQAVPGAWLMSWQALHGRLGSGLHSGVYWAAPTKKLVCLG